MPWPERPSMLASGRLLAEDLDALLDQIEELSNTDDVLAADTAGVNNSTTLVNTTLSVPVRASTYYTAFGMFPYTAGLGEDFKPGISTPSGTTILRSTLLSGPASASPSNPVADQVYFGSDTTIGALSAPGMNTSSNVVVCYYTVSFLTGGNAGNAIAQYAQGTAGAGTTTFMRRGAIWTVRRANGV